MQQKSAVLKLGDSWGQATGSAQPVHVSCNTAMFQGHVCFMHSKFQNSGFFILPLMENMASSLPNSSTIIHASKVQGNLNRPSSSVNSVFLELHFLMGYNNIGWALLIMKILLRKHMQLM
jgi:hypothetical protein